MKVSGRTTVGKFKELFKEEFGTSVRVYQGRKFADNSSTLASIRKDDAKIKGNVEIRGNMKVGNVEKLFLNEYGIVIQIEDQKGKLADNTVTIASLRNADNSAVSKKSGNKLADSKSSRKEKIEQEDETTQEYTVYLETTGDVRYFEFCRIPDEELKADLEIENLSETNYGDVHDIYDINDYFTFRILRSANADKKITLKPFVVYDQKVEGTFSYRIEDENEKLLEEESNIQFSKIKDNNKLTDNSKVPNNLNELTMETGAFSPSYSVDSLQLFLESEHFEASKYMRNDKTNSNSEEDIERFKELLNEYACSDKHFEPGFYLLKGTFYKNSHNSLVFDVNSKDGFDVNKLKKVVQTIDVDLDCEMDDDNCQYYSNAPLSCTNFSYGNVFLTYDGELLTRQYVDDEDYESSFVWIFVINKEHEIENVTFAWRDDRKGQSDVQEYFFQEYLEALKKHIDLIN